MVRPVRDRVRSHRKELQAYGLKRVELTVPAEREAALRDFAMRLREEAAEQRLSELRSLLKEAFKDYRAACLDNIDVDVDRAGPAEAKVVADALMKRGGSDAFLLGRKIMKLARHP